MSHTSLDLRAMVALPSGKSMAIRIPCATLQQENFDVKSANSDVMEDLAFTATVDPPLGDTLQVDLI